MSLRNKKWLVLCVVAGMSIWARATAAPTLNKENRWIGYEPLKRACSCESWGDPNKEPRQYDDKGKLIVGQTTPDDKGACQISLRYNGKEAKQKALLDVVHSEEQNIQFAKILYDKHGLQPWSASKSCWSRG